MSLKRPLVDSFQFKVGSFLKPMSLKSTKLGEKCLFYLKFNNNLFLSVNRAISQNIDVHKIIILR